LVAIKSFDSNTNKKRNEQKEKKRESGRPINKKNMRNNNIFIIKKINTHFFSNNPNTSGTLRKDAILGKKPQRLHRLGY
jgi:hypothetical protein